MKLLKKVIDSFNNFKKKIFYGTTKYIINILFMFSIVPLLTIIIIFLCVYIKTSNDRIEKIQGEIAERIGAVISANLDKYVSDANNYAEFITSKKDSGDFVRDISLSIIKKNSEYDMTTLTDKNGNVKFKFSRYHTFKNKKKENISSAVTFNKMIETIMNYTNHLQDMVVERTEELEKALSALWGEMELAKKIQTVLLPKKPKIDGYEICGYMNPADEIGGDYYDVIRVNNKDWFLIGDVSGHGVVAGLIMMMVQTAIHTILSNNAELKPSKVLELINLVIRQNITKLEEDKYMTMTLFGAYEGGKFYYSGFHQDLLVYREKENRVEEIESRGMWLGLVKDIEGMLKNDYLTLDSGDILLLYTDGITEAVRTKDDSKFNLFGVSKLKEILKSSGKETPHKIKENIVSALEPCKINDDVTMLILKKV